MVATYRQVALLLDARRMNATPWVVSLGPPKARRGRFGYGWARGTGAVKGAFKTLQAYGSKALQRAKGAFRALDVSTPEYLLRMSQAPVPSPSFSHHTRA